MTQVSFPGPDFPAVPSIAFEAPTGWEPLLVPSTIVAIAPEARVDEFRPNVVASWHRNGSEFTLTDAAAAVRDKIDSLVDHEMVTDLRYTVSGLEAQHFEVIFRADNAGTVAQITDLIVVPHGSICDLFEITATCAASQVESTFNVLRQILAGARISV